MPENTMPGPGCELNSVRESVCIHTRKIFDSCRDKDCVEDLRFYPTASAMELLSGCQMVRGGTAELLKQKLTMPVVEITFSVYDILRAIKMAENYNSLYAIVGFPSITGPAHTLCDLLRFNTDIVTVHSEAEVRSALERLETVMTEAGELEKDQWVDFDKLVDNSFAQKAMEAQ